MRQTQPEADWSPLRNALASVDDRLTIAWDELDASVGGLPLGIPALRVLERRSIRLAWLQYDQRPRR